LGLCVDCCQHIRVGKQFKENQRQLAEEGDTIWVAIGDMPLYAGNGDHIEPFKTMGFDYSQRERPEEMLVALLRQLLNENETPTKEEPYRVLRSPYARRANAPRIYYRVTPQIADAVEGLLGHMDRLYKTAYMKGYDHGHNLLDALASGNTTISEWNDKTTRSK
jgi:hypothetical protein